MKDPSSAGGGVAHGDPVSEEKFGGNYVEAALAPKKRCQAQQREGGGAIFSGF